MTFHKKKEPYKCPVCSKEFQTSYLLERHIDSHSGHKPFVCPVCDKTYTSSKDLHIHIQTHFPKHLARGAKKFSELSMDKRCESTKAVHAQSSSYICEICGICFPFQTDIKEHMKVHQDAGTTVSAAIADRTGSSHQASLKEPHSRKYAPTAALPSSKDIYICAECKVCYPTSGSLQEHMKSHKAFSQVITRLNAPIPTENALDIHMNQKQALLLEQSQANNQETTGPSSVQANTVSKLVSRQPLNPIETNCITQTSLQATPALETATHPVSKNTISNSCKPNATGIEAPSYVCVYCQKGFSDLLVLQNHMQTHADLNCLPFPIFGNSETLSNDCVQTASTDIVKQFGESTEDVLHFANSGGEQLHVCNECWKTFDDAVALSEHIQMHRERHKCSKCRKEFKTMKSLESHFKIHTSGKPAKKQAKDLGNRKKIPCRYCAKTFWSSSGLHNHMYIHVGKRPYGCPICKRRFIQSSDVQKHLPTHRDKNMQQSQALQKTRPPLREQVNHQIKQPDNIAQANTSKQVTAMSVEQQTPLRSNPPNPGIVAKPVDAFTSTSYCPNGENVTYTQISLRQTASLTAPQTTTGVVNKSANILTNVLNFVEAEHDRPVLKPNSILPDIGKNLASVVYHEEGVSDIALLNCDRKAMQDAYSCSTDSSTTINHTQSYQKSYEENQQSIRLSNSFASHFFMDSFSKPEALLNYKRTCWEREHTQLYGCEQCGKVCKTLSALHAHQHMHDFKTHPCQFCESIHLSSCLARHTLIHTEKRPDDQSLHIRRLMETAALRDQRPGLQRKQSLKDIQNVDKSSDKAYCHCEAGLKHRSEPNRTTTPGHRHASAYTDCIECVCGFALREDLDDHLAIHKLLARHGSTN